MSPALGAAALGGRNGRKESTVDVDLQPCAGFCHKRVQGRGGQRAGQTGALELRVCPRHATSVWQGNRFSVAISPVSKSHSVIPAPAPPELSMNVRRPACGSVGPCSN